MGLSDGSTQWERILGRGNYAWAYGGSQLRRIDLPTLVLGTANLLGSVNLLQVTDMSFSSGDLLRLDGVGSTGGPVVVSLDTVTGAITIETTDIPRFQDVVPLQ